jgi:HEAT repeat protein
MKSVPSSLLITLSLVFPGCARPDRGPLLAGGREVKLWIEKLRDLSPRVRRQAVLKLGNVGDADPAVAAGLADALVDADALVRRDAVRAVAKLKSPSDTIIARLGIMSRSDSDPGVRDVAERALDKFGRID